MGQNEAIVFSPACGRAKLRLIKNTQPESRMCNLYSLTKGQAAIRDLFRARHDRAGNLPLLPGIFPDQTAPIVRLRR